MEGEVEAFILALVLEKMSKILLSVAGLMLSRSLCSASVGSTPKASPIH